MVSKDQESSQKKTYIELHDQHQTSNSKTNLIIMTPRIAERKRDPPEHSMNKTNTIL